MHECVCEWGRGRERERERAREMQCGECMCVQERDLSREGEQSNREGDSGKRVEAAGWYRAWESEGEREKERKQRPAARLTLSVASWISQSPAVGAVSDLRVDPPAQRLRVRECLSVWSAQQSAPWRLRSSLCSKTVSGLWSCHTQEKVWPASFWTWLNTNDPQPSLAYPLIKVWLEKEKRSILLTMLLLDCWVLSYDLLQGIEKNKLEMERIAWQITLLVPRLSFFVYCVLSDRLCVQMVHDPYVISSWLSCPCDYCSLHYVSIRLVKDSWLTVFTWLS